MPEYLLLPAGLISLSLAIAAGLYLLTARGYQSSDSVANAYDQWTEDGILEYYWGDHIHLGHYGDPPVAKDFIQSKIDFVHAMAQWGGLDTLPPAQRYWMWVAALAVAVAFSPKIMVLTLPASPLVPNR